MTKEDFIYALENEGLIRAVRDDHNRIDVEETIKSRDFKTGCWMPTGEWLDIKTIWRIMEDNDMFED